MSSCHFVFTKVSLHMSKPQLGEILILYNNWSECWRRHRTFPDSRKADVDPVSVPGSFIHQSQAAKLCHLSSVQELLRVKQDQDHCFDQMCPTSKTFKDKPQTTYRYISAFLYKIFCESIFLHFASCCCATRKNYVSTSDSSRFFP